MKYLVLYQEHTSDDLRQEFFDSVFEAVVRCDKLRQSDYSPAIYSLCFGELVLR